MSTDPISDMLTRIRNANLRKHKIVKIPFSKMKESIAKVILSEGFIYSYKVEGVTYNREIVIDLKYDTKSNSIIRGLKRESKPGRRIYRSIDDLGCVLNGQGIYIVSTSQGVLSDSDCRKHRVAGEVICSVY